WAGRGDQVTTRRCRSSCVIRLHFPVRPQRRRARAARSRRRAAPTAPAQGSGGRRIGRHQADGPLRGTCGVPARRVVRASRTT
ncbi:MAG: hypothetical protein AVDCRST_MAG66-1733, partial [uncultured Pseudonocardia sp.]